MLELSYISKVIGVRSVLNNINLQIPEGQRVVFCGDLSGASWLLRVISGNVQVKRGEVLLEEEPIQKMVSHLSYMGFEGSLLWDKSVAYSVNLRKAWYTNWDEPTYQRRGMDFGAEAPSKVIYHKLDRESRAAEVLAFGISLGCQIWLVDELLSSCGEKPRQNFYKVMSEHTKAGGTALVCLPEELLCREAMGLFDRLIYMKEGSVVADVDLTKSDGKPLEVRMKEWKGR